MGETKAYVEREEFLLGYICVLSYVCMCHICTCTYILTVFCVRQLLIKSLNAFASDMTKCLLSTNDGIPGKQYVLSDIC